MLTVFLVSFKYLYLITTVEIDEPFLKTQLLTALSFNLEKNIDMINDSRVIPIHIYASPAYKF